MIRTSETVGTICAALVKAQAVMPGVPKATKGQVGSQIRFYADLSDVLDVVRPILAEHGLAYVQFPCESVQGSVAVATRLVHESGEWMESEVSMPSQGSGAQGVGSAITYARRYSLMAVLGLAAEDDDGAAASVRRTPPAPRAARAEPQPSSSALTDAQMRKLQALANDKGLTERNARLAMWSTTIGRDVTTANDLTKTEAGTIIDAMERL
jgi:ERF superfamily